MTAYRVFSALFSPILFFGVPIAQITIEAIVCLFLGLFVSWYFIGVVVVLHIVSYVIYKKNQFALKVLIDALFKTPLKTDFIEDNK